MIPVDFLRALSNQFLPQACEIRRYTETVTGDGTTQTWSNVANGVPCRISPQASSASEALGAGASLQAVATWTIWLPALQSVTVKDRIVHGDRTFEIVRVGERSYEVVRELICKEVT